MNPLLSTIEALEFAETLLPGLPLDDAEALAGCLNAHRRALYTLVTPGQRECDGDCYIPRDHGIRPTARIASALTFAEGQLDQVLASWNLSVTGRRIVAGARFGIEAVRCHVEAHAPEEMPVARFVLAERRS